MWIWKVIFTAPVQIMAKDLELQICDTYETNLIKVCYFYLTKFYKDNLV